MPFSSIIYLLPLAGYWLILIYYLGVQWSVYDQYRYGWAVPFLCLYLIWRKAKTLKAEKLKAGGGKAEIGNGESEPAAMSSRGSKLDVGCLPEARRPSSVVSSPALPSSAPVSFSAFQLFSFFLLCLLYAPTRFLHEANPIWRFTSLLWTLEVIALTLLLLRTIDYGPLTKDHGPEARDHVSRFTFHAPRFTFHVSRTTFHVSRFTPHVSHFTFPVLFFLVAVPWPSGLENFLTQSLMRLNSATTVELLGLLGVPALQHGNVIEVGSGVVGIDEACSGIRSLQATLMISLFLGELYALSAWRRLFCVGAGFALAFVFNVGRTLLLTRVAAAKGVGAVAAWHDPAGVTILVACFLCLWLIARALRGKAETLKSSAQEAERKKQESEPGPACFQYVSFSAFQLFSIFLTVWLLVVEAGTQLWYWSHERATGPNVEWSVPRPALSSSYKEVEIPPGIRGQFNYDEGTQARWEDGSGDSWQLYYFRWFPAHSLRKRVAIQLAKTHGPEICLPAVGMRVSAYLGIITVPVAGMELAMQQYVFNAEGKKIHVFYGIYEDPSGSSELANRRQDARSRIAAALAGSRNYGQRFLEVAVVGYERPEEAKAALGRELDKLIKVGEQTGDYGPLTKDQ